MTSDRLITPISIVLVILLHYGLFLLGHSYNKPSIEIGVWGMEVVDLGDMDLGEGQDIGVPDAPPQPEPPKPEPPKPKPKVEPKPVKEKIVATQTTEKADIVTKQEEIEPVVEDTSTASDTATTDETSSPSGPSQGGDRKLIGRGSSGGGGQAGSGSGTTQATHMGGHLRNPKPPYPPLSLENGEEGTVGLTVMVEPDGRPSDVQLAKSSGYRRLDNSALKTVKSKYRFTPATRGGFPIRAQYTFNIVFKIE